MNTQNKWKGQLSRRKFIGYTAAATAYSFLPGIIRAKSFSPGLLKPDSTFGGVPIGAITYSFRSLPGTNAEDTLDYLLQCGLSHCELMSGPIEESAGAPTVNFMEIIAEFMPERPQEQGEGAPGGERDSVPEGERQRQRFQMPPGAREAIEEKQKELTEWRKNITSMDQFKEIRDMYNKAGVNIHIVKFDNIGADSVSPEEHEYMFNVAKTMGAKGITTELDEMKAKKLAPLAQKHGIAIAFHNHTQLTPTTYSEGPYFSYGKSIMANLDIGHYAAGTGQSPLPLVKELAEQNRLLSIHLKDRTFGGDTVPFGEGDAQVAEILQLIRKNKWNIYCDIELEYPIPEDSDAIIETGKCVEFCKKVLT
jgi:sugar phosphate isomerase/epimerase